MKKIILNQEQFNKLNGILKEGMDRYMFFSNLEQIRTQANELLKYNRNDIEQLLDDGHDWAQDHIASSTESIDQVYDFMKNNFENRTNMKQEEPMLIDDMESSTEHLEDRLDDEQLQVQEGRKKTGTKLCARGKSAAKAKFDVYPSAYANGYAIQVCKGKIKGLDGKKRCSPPYC